MKSPGLALIACALLSCVASAAENKNFITHGPRSLKVIALTFDDGPGPYTERILEVLNRYGVKATFFMEGLQAEMRPSLAGKVAAAGHEIGNHTYQHVNLYAYKKDDKEMMLASELQRAAACIKKSTGRDPCLARLPNGYSRAWALQTAARQKYTVINWTFGCDWQKMTADQMAASYIQQLQPGAILLLHDGGGKRQRTLDALPRIIESAQQQGYRLVTVGELLGMDAEN